MLARAELIRRRNDFCVVAMIAPHLVVERYDSESSTLGLFFKLESALLAIHDLQSSFAGTLSLQYGYTLLYVLTAIYQ